MVAMANADLHSHSVASDGTLTPAELARRAKNNGVELWSLTDHDDISGQPDAQQAAQALGLPYLTGVEISVSFLGQTVHIVGLGFEVGDLQLRQGLARTRNGRLQRARDMANALEAIGITGVLEGALKLAGNPEVISRAHLARQLVQLGICDSVQHVFRHYLTEGKPGYVPHRWASLADTVHWINAAGGIAVIAHPARYRFTAMQEYALFSEFVQHGGLAVEVVTGSHQPYEYGKYAEFAQEFGLMASRGSDFHSPQESLTDLGALPPLPAGLKPVWHALAERVR